MGIQKAEGRTGWQPALPSAFCMPIAKNGKEREAARALCRSRSSLLLLDLELDGVGDLAVNSHGNINHPASDQIAWQQNIELINPDE